ncbi:NPH3 family [Musa troglodytarum]|uniref:NPH3 family n=1 Tax=Musa troglodytarum TaxID=320322 RepID=A0A9E7J986_9LILI|nr:NPH3 family [Musa troglodytarum]
MPPSLPPSPRHILLFPEVTTGKSYGEKRGREKGLGDDAGEICTVPGDEAVHLSAILWFDQQEVIGFDFALVLFEQEIRALLMNSGLATSIFSDVDGDLTVHVDGQSFLLHKFPLVSRSGRFWKMANESRNPDLSRLELHGVPGGAEAFELAAKFCYGTNFEITPNNVAKLRCIAEYLEMSEQYKECNLIARTETYLDEIVSQSVEKSLEVLCACDGLHPMVEDVGLLDRCINAIANNVSKEQLVSGLAHLECDSRSEKMHCQYWWVEELSVLNIELYKRVITAMRRKGVRSDSIIQSIVHYAQNTLKDSQKQQPWDFGVVVGDKQRVIVVVLVGLLATEKITSVPLYFLFGILRMAVEVDAGLSSKQELERRIGFQLELASLDDLLIPSLQTSDSVFDVDTVHRILVNFLKRIDEEDSEESSQCSYESQGLKSISHSSVLKVGRLIDGYLAEIAPDPYLKLPKFVALIQLLPEYARVIDDGIYRAIDIYLKGLEEAIEIKAPALQQTVNMHGPSIFRSLLIPTSSGSDLGRPPEDSDVISGGSRMSHICKNSPISARSVPAASLLLRRERSNASPPIGSVLESDGQEGPESNESVGKVKINWSGIDDLLDADFGKHDYDWLLTPPGPPHAAPLVSIEKQLPAAAPNYSSTARSSSTASASRLSASQTENGHSARPARSSSVTHASLSSCYVSDHNKTLALNANSISATSKPSTPIKRPVTPSTAKTLTPVSYPLQTHSFTPVKTRSASGPPCIKPEPSYNSRPATPTSRSQFSTSANSNSSLVAAHSISRSSTATCLPISQATTSASTVRRSPSVGRLSASNGRIPHSASSSCPSSPNRQPQVPKGHDQEWHLLSGQVQILKQWFLPVQTEKFPYHLNLRASSQKIHQKLLYTATYFIPIYLRTKSLWHLKLDLVGLLNRLLLQRALDLEEQFQSHHSTWLLSIWTSARALEAFGAHQFFLIVFSLRYPVAELLEHQRRLFLSLMMEFLLKMVVIREHLGTSMEQYRAT